MKSIDRNTGPLRDAATRDARPRTWSAMPRMSRRVVIASMALMVAACSSIKLGYNSAETLLLYGLDSYFDLDETQEQLARERMRPLLAWHRTQELPTYAQFLDEAQRALNRPANQPISADDILALQERINGKLARLGEQAAPELARLALALQPAQIDRFARKLADDNAKARREVVRFAGKESLEERIKASRERAESWLGSVSREQDERIRAHLMSRPSGQAWWMDERERRQRELVAVMQRIQREQPSEELATRWLRDYMAQLALPPDGERRARILEFRRGNAELMAQLVNSATPAQKTTLMKKLRGYADDFTTLASTGRRS